MNNCLTCAFVALNQKRLVRRSKLDLAIKLSQLPLVVVRGMAGGVVMRTSYTQRTFCTFRVAEECAVPVEGLDGR